LPQLVDRECALVGLAVVIFAQGDEPARFMVLADTPRRVEMMPG
jgi:hypothetical protein